MTNATDPCVPFTLSGFGDEIDADLDVQLDALQRLGIEHLELRGVWAKNVLELSDDEVARVARSLADRGMAVSAIGSPIGKVPMDYPLEQHIDELRRILNIAQRLGSEYVRIFSFYVREDEAPGYRSQVIDGISAMVRAAEGSGITLLHENEKEIYGDTPERAADILDSIDSPLLRAVWDPANFVQVGIEAPFDRGWPLLGRHVVYVHIKDALLGSGDVTPAGEGDGQVPELLQALAKRGTPTFLSLEPHLVVAGSSHGYSGEDVFGVAVQALRRLIADISA